MTYNTKVVLAYFKEMGLPEPIPEYRFFPSRRWRFDFAWLYAPFEEGGTCLEVEGGAWTGGRHTRGAGFLKDQEKYNCATSLGWRVLRCTPDTLCMKETADLIRKTLDL